MSPEVSLVHRAWRALVLNRQFAAFLAVLLLALVAFPGSPGRSLLDDMAAASGPLPQADPPTTVSRETLTSVVTGIVDSFDQTPPPSTTTTVGGPAGPPATLPRPPEEPPPPACATDAATSVYDQVQGPAQDALGQPLPSRSVHDLAAIAAGCSDADPTGAVLNLALDLAALVPDSGIAPIPLPGLPNVPVPPVPQEVVEALSPLAGPIKEGCANLAVVALLLAILPAAAHLPVRGSDLAQLIGPASSVCAVFDEEQGR